MLALIIISFTTTLQAQVNQINDTGSVGIGTLVPQESLDVRGNAAVDRDCTIKFDGKIKNANFYLLSYDGTVLMQEKWTEKKKTIDMSVFAASIYLVVIKNDKEVYTNKIIKL